MEIKKTPLKNQLIHYSELLDRIKVRIRQGQTRVVLSANAAMIHTYWDIGCMLHDQQLTRGWGTAVIPKISKDIHNKLPQVKGFSERNLNRMIAFYRAYPDLHLILPQRVAKLSPCQDREKVLAEYALRSIKKPIGVSQYELTRALPKQLKSSLPAIEQIEAEMSSKRGRKKKSKKQR